MSKEVKSIFSPGPEPFQINENFEASPLIAAEDFFNGVEKRWIWPVTLLTGIARVGFGGLEILAGVALSFFKLIEAPAKLALHGRESAVLSLRESLQAFTYILHGIANIARGIFEITPAVDLIHTFANQEAPDSDIRYFKYTSENAPKLYQTNPKLHKLLEDNPGLAANISGAKIPPQSHLPVRDELVRDMARKNVQIYFQGKAYPNKSEWQAIEKAMKNKGDDSAARDVVEEIVQRLDLALSEAGVQQKLRSDVLGYCYQSLLGLPTAALFARITVLDKVAELKPCGAYIDKERPFIQSYIEIKDGEVQVVGQISLSFRTVDFWETPNAQAALLGTIRANLTTERFDCTLERFGTVEQATRKFQDGYVSEFATLSIPHRPQIEQLES